MKTLYERLKPEHKAKLDEQSIKYPSAIPAAIKEMTNNNSVLDLRYLTIQSLYMYLDLKNSNIDTIMNLFEANELLNVNSK